MAGIYVHVPFCKKACSYCNFYFSTSLANKEEYINALLKEISLRKSFLGDEPVKTLYFGGGTPSLLTAGEIRIITDRILETFSVDHLEEFTIESNPDDVSEAWLKKIKQTQVNRISLGVQSFHDDDLLLLGRVHSGKEAENAIRNIRNSGIENITADLIYAIPTLTSQKWESNLQKMEELGIPHISAYALTIEERTLLSHKIEKGQLPPIDENIFVNHYDQLVDFAEKNNYIQYEISNFGKEGYFGKHNINYWKRIKYLGLGPSAHSFDEKGRYWNVANNNLYIKALNSGKEFYEMETLTVEDRLNEYLMTGLRTIWGIDPERIKKLADPLQFREFNEILADLISEGFLENNEDKIRLTNKGKKIADSLISDLFFTTD